MSIYSESDRYMWVFCITYYLAETCLIRLKIVVNKNNNKKENRKGKIMDFIELLKVIFLGIVEGITEWLPISSTGHMILVDEFLKLNVTEDFKNLFFVVIQLGAILAVVAVSYTHLDDSIGEVVIKREYIEGNGGPRILLRGQEPILLEGSH